MIKRLRPSTTATAKRPPKPEPPKIKQPEGKPEIPEPILAEAILEIHKGFKRLRMSGLNRRGIVVLVRDASGVSMHDINAVLDALDSLADKYTRRGG